MTPGQLLRRLREGRYTQEQLAHAIGVTTSSVTQWEIGRMAPRRQRVEQMDTLLDANGELLDAFGYARPTSQADELDELRDRLGRLEAKVDRLLDTLTPTNAGTPVRHLRAAKAAPSRNAGAPDSGRRYTRPSPPAEDGDHTDD